MSKLIGICNQSLEVFDVRDASIDQDDAIGAAKALDIDRGIDGLNPKYRIVSELWDRDSGYIIASVDDSVDSENSVAVEEAIADAGYYYVATSYDI